MKISLGSQLESASSAFGGGIATSSIADHSGVWTSVAEVLRQQSERDALLILPPFAGIDRPSLGLHTLQACAKSAGLGVSVLYANVLFARILSESRYERLCYAPTSDLLGERIFAKAAYGQASQPTLSTADRSFRSALPTDELPTACEIQQYQQLAIEFSDTLADLIANSGHQIVGCNTTFEQTSAAVAILARIKQRAPRITTLLGGANCEGRMALGIRTLSPCIDVIFSGESEVSFPKFLVSDRRHELAPGTIIEGEACKNLDQLPALDYSDYYAQLELLAPDGHGRNRANSWLPYETSRGCWWGQKHHCTFCGINGGGMTFRQKSAQIVLTQLPALLAQHPSNKVLMVDNIMPIGYFDDLLPALASMALGLHAFYEQKANLTLERVVLLKNAGVAIIQPGIEALSSALLALMKKGVKASQNVALLRYTRSAGVSVNWNILYAFPGDHEEHYESTLRLMPLLRHLNPPSGACHLSIDRFSPYFDRPGDYGIANVRPMEAYETIFPSAAAVPDLAYHFVGDYDCAVRRDASIVPRLDAEIEAWRRSWGKPEAKPPVLLVEEIDAATYLLCDTRADDTSKHQFRFIDKDQARVALAAQSIAKVSDSLRNWAVDDAQVAVILDGRLIPLACARPELIEQFESPHGTAGLASADRVA